MLAPGRFTKVTSLAKVSGLEKDVIIRIFLHSLPMIVGCNVRRGGSCNLVYQKMGGNA